MVEKKLRGNLSAASQDNQQALIALYGTMLHEHHDICSESLTSTTGGVPLERTDEKVWSTRNHTSSSSLHTNNAPFPAWIFLHQWTISDGSSIASFISKSSVWDTLLTLTPQDKAKWYPCIRRSSHSSALPACSVTVLPKTSPWARSLPYPPPFL